MSRYVDLSEKVTATYYDEQYEEWDHHTVTIEDVLNEVCDDYTVLPTIEPEQRWIPCSERLPFAEYGESDNVLATCGYRDVEDTSIRWIRTLYFNGGTWCYPTGETYEQKVYAWMQLPTPYKGDTE